MSESVANDVDMWLANAGTMYDMAVKKYEATKAEMQTLIERGAAELRKVNQIGAALGRTPYDAPMAVADKPAVVVTPSARPPRVSRAPVSKPPSHDAPTGAEDETDDEGFAPDEA